MKNNGVSRYATKPACALNQAAVTPSRYDAGPTNDFRMMWGSCAKRFRVRSPA